MKVISIKPSTFTKTLLLGAAAMFLTCALPFSVHAQDQDAQQQATPVYAPAQLDQMLAPIALYPDDLVGQVLMASTYPLEVVEAYRWQQNPANAGLQGDALQELLDQQPWDPSVKSLIAFPQVLKTMNDNLQWTEQLGDAFLAQQPAVMNEVQQLRQRAQASGHLQSTPQAWVETQESEIVIQPADPDVVYVPAYNPQLVYGAWPYSAYPPYYFAGYPAYGAVIGFGAGIAVADWFWGWNHWDWRGHRLDIDNRRFSELNRGHPPVAGNVWRHDPSHRDGVPYRSPAVRAQYPNNRSPETARGYRGYNTPAPQARPQANSNRFQQQPQNFQHVTARPVNRPNVVPQTAQAPAPEQHFERPQNVARPQNFQRPASNQVFHQAPAAAAPAFESFSHNGGDVRSQAMRGASSRASAPSPANFARPAAPAAAPHMQGGGGDRGGEHGGGGDRHR